jgi:hypothetical protein
MSAYETHTPETGTSETHSAPESRSIASLLSDLSHEIITLVRQELQLARAEASEKVSQVQAGIASIAIGAAVTFGGFLIFLEFLVYGLADILSAGSIQHMWLSALIVGILVLIIGFALLKYGQNNLKARHLTPHRTTKSLRRDTELAKEQWR